jgi:hypothetical protein
MGNVKLKRRLYEDLLQKQRSLQIFTQRVKRSDDLVVLEPASMPTEPYSPSMQVNLFLGALCGLTFGCGIAIILPYDSKKQQISPLVDERKAKRYPCSNKVTYTVAGEKGGLRTSYGKDISSTGMSIVGDKILKKNDKLKFNIENPNKDPIKGNGIVIWSSPAFRKGETGGYVAGVKFEDLDLNINNSES